MKKFQRIASVVLSIGMLMSTQSMAFAQDAAPVDVPGSQLIQEETNNLYSNFPVQINKSIRKDMGMDMSFRYLKGIDENDSVQITIKDLNTNSVCAEETLSPTDKKLSFKNVPNNAVYSVTVNEQIDGVANEYVGYVKTKFVQTDFPVDLKLGDVEYENNSGETHSNVLIKKVGENPECNHEEDEECTEACSIGSVVSEITESELDSFYSELDANAYYELQTEASAGGRTNLYQGFISTYDGGEYEGVFSRGYSFHDTLDYIDGYPATYAARALPDFSNPVEYQHYQNLYTTLDYSDEHVIKFVAPFTGYYTIETIGNADTMFEIYSETDGVINTSPRIVRSGGTGQNARTNIGLLVNDEYQPVKYIVLTLEDGDPAPCAFRIVRDPEITNGDSVTNFRNEVQTNCENDYYSPEVIENGCIDYNGDVDVFGYDVVSGQGYVELNCEAGQEMEAVIYSVTTEKQPFDSCWYEDTVSSEDGVTQLSFSTGRHYVEIRQEKDSLPPFGDESEGYYDDAIYEYLESFDYSFGFYHPRYKDQLDRDSHPTYGNNAPMFSTDITETIITNSLPYDREDLTLHKGDSDWFIFKTDENGGNLSVTVTKADNIPTYIPHLYDYEEVEIINTEQPEWSVPVDMVDYVSSADGRQNTLTYNGLEPDHMYYIKIDRVNSTSYSSKHTYGLRIEVTIPDVPTATLSGDVTLNHTVGETISSTNVLIEELMDSLTCYINGATVEDSISISDVELFYNGTELTAGMVNVMAEGTYPLVAEYQGVVATGGSINLVVSAAPSEDNIIMLDNLPLESVTHPSWDWAGAARIMANTRLIREGSAQTNYTVQQAIMAVKTGGYTTRGTLEEVVKAANYFYSGGSQDTYNFINDTIDVSTAESTLSTALNNGQVVIMQLTSISNPSDLASMRYIVLCGINLTTHEYIVFDPIENEMITVSQNTIHTGGYNGNSDLRFTGQVIEFL